MRDVAALATRVVILRNGRKVHDLDAPGLSTDDLGHLIMGA